ncbi:MAG: formylmethanofuran dehydrogenase subunit A [Gemmatimonadaceae bacterium]
MTQLRITGGAIHDPANGIDGDVRDICIDGGRIVASLPADAPVLRADGMVIMAGGIDIHAHIAASSVSMGRRLLPEEHTLDPVAAPALDDAVIPRSGTGGTVPSTFTTGYRYAGLGYTTVFDAAVAPVAARQTHAEFDDTPIIDGGFYALLGNDEYLHRQIAANEIGRAKDYAAWILKSTGGYAIKVVNPGGVELWKRNVREVKTIDDPVGASNVTPRRILEVLANAATELGLPHPVHIHCNNLGVAGNVATTLESMRALEGQRAHFTHLQFHSYGGERGKSWSSAARQVAEYVNSHPEITGDVGQVMFGDATTLTADGAVEYLLHKSTGKKWINADIELETGCGIVPYQYKDKAAIASLQWVVGLELFLLSTDPWRMVLSTDHPNGGSFMSYPDLIRLLMDRAYRDEKLKNVNQKMLAGSALADGIAREYTLNEIAIITRAGPARQLGLRQKGQLGVGADADITIYSRDANYATMFATPRYVVKAGTLVVEEGQLRRAPAGKRIFVQPGYDESLMRDLGKYFEAYSAIQLANYSVTGLRDAPMPTGAV